MNKKHTSIATFAVKRLTQEEALKYQKPFIVGIRRPIHNTYKSTNDEQRILIVQKILNNEWTVGQAAAVYGLKYTTIKNILNLYQKYGRITKKRTRSKFPSEISEVIQSTKYMKGDVSNSIRKDSTCNNGSIEKSPEVNNRKIWEIRN